MTTPRIMGNIAVTMMLVGVPCRALAQVPADTAAKVDALFDRWGRATPGCAVGISINGRTVLSKAYGMADLEHDVPNTQDTIFEAGSVSKQFTAAAVLLLARDGKLSLDDPARKYIPELPDYGTPLTIRHMLTHTSGLRDWGSVEGIAGWPRTTREYTHAHVLDIVSRQKALNFTPGTRWSYSNTGFNLAAVIVSRVSGMSFAEFTRLRIFEPLGMTHTSWRDDHTRIVKGRAIAYNEQKDGFHIEMPFENVYGNGGLLTTVGDLLIWNEHFARPRPGDEGWVAQQQEVGRFSDGREHDYAFGLWVDPLYGQTNVWHSGSTAGYRAHLNRFRESDTSVAVLCNVSSGDATQKANAVSAIALDQPSGAPPSISGGMDPVKLRLLEGLYRNTTTGLPLSLAVDADRLKPTSGAALEAKSETTFASAEGGATWDFTPPNGLRITDRFGRVDTYERAEPATPMASELKALAGRYASDEAETTLTAEVDGDSLVLRRRPDARIVLTPVYKDAFRGSIGCVIFRRDQSGNVVALSIVQDRVWDLRFSIARN